MSNMALVIAVSVMVGFLLRGFVDLVVRSLSTDGRIVIDETKDSYFIAIRTVPSKIVKKKTITLTVYHT